jgi:hypothetical protein
LKKVILIVRSKIKSMKLRHKKPFYKHPAFIAASILVIVLILLELTNTTHILHKSSSETTKSPNRNTTGEGSATKTPQGTTTPANTTTESNDTKQTSAQASTLLDPTGNFVSAHKNVPKSASLSSVCNTTSGAECKIVFTNGSISKSLDPQTTDSNGSSFWNSWSPEDIGLTSGSWQVQAVATLNGQSKTSTDAMKLEIQ